MTAVKTSADETKKQAAEVTVSKAEKVKDNKATAPETKEQAVATNVPKDEKNTPSWENTSLRRKPTRCEKRIRTR